MSRAISSSKLFAHLQVRHCPCGQFVDQLVLGENEIVAPDVPLGQQLGLVQGKAALHDVHVARRWGIRGYKDHWMQVRRQLHQKVLVCAFQKPHAVEDASARHPCHLALQGRRQEVKQAAVRPRRPQQLRLVKVLPQPLPHLVREGLRLHEALEVLCVNGWQRDAAQHAHKARAARQSGWVRIEGGDHTAKGPQHLRPRDRRDQHERHSDSLLGRIALRGRDVAVPYRRDRRDRPVKRSHVYGRRIPALKVDARGPRRIQRQRAVTIVAEPRVDQVFAEVGLQGPGARHPVCDQHDHEAGADEREQAVLDGYLCLISLEDARRADQAQHLYEPQRAHHAEHLQLLKLVALYEVERRDQHRQQVDREPAAYIVAGDGRRISNPC
eukprot:5290300-Prymnesium_polylepis.4